MMKKFSSGMFGIVAVIALIIGGFVTLNLVKKHEFQFDKNLNTGQFIPQQDTQRKSQT